VRADKQIENAVHRPFLKYPPPIKNPSTKTQRSKPAPPATQRSDPATQQARDTSILLPSASLSLHLKVHAITTSTTIVKKTSVIITSISASVAVNNYEQPTKVKVLSILDRY
jgi:hypothetical protein